MVCRLRSMPDVVTCPEMCEILKTGVKGGAPLLDRTHNTTYGHFLRLIKILSILVTISYHSSVEVE